MVLFGLTVCVDVCTAIELDVLDAPLVVVAGCECVPVEEPVPVAVVGVVDVVLSVTTTLEPPEILNPGDHCQ